MAINSIAHGWKSSARATVRLSILPSLRMSTALRERRSRSSPICWFPSDSRVEFAARSGSQDLTVDLDRIFITYERYAPTLLAAGESAVIVNNRAAFESRYGAGRRILGEYSGALD